jgi:hypothetical protein
MTGLRNRIKEEGKESRDQCFPTRRYIGHYLTLKGRDFGGWRLAGSGPISRAPNTTIKIKFLFSYFNGLEVLVALCWGVNRIFLISFIMLAFVVYTRCFL